MQFNVLFPIIRKYMNPAGYDVPDFVRELLTILVKVPERDWDTPKDPGGYTTNEHTLRNIAKKGPSRKLAKSVVYHLSSKNFIKAVSRIGNDGKRLFVMELSAYDSTVNIDNLGEKVYTWLEEIFKEKAGLIPTDQLTRRGQLDQSLYLKNKYGEYLLHEADYHCSYPGCGQQLRYALDGNVQDVYDISRIDKDADDKLTNLIALCPRCLALYQMDPSKLTTKALWNSKKISESHLESQKLMNEAAIEKGIINVINKMMTTLCSADNTIEFNPKEIQQKIDPNKHRVLYNTVINHSNEYFRQVKSIMKDLDKSGEIDYEDLQNQIRAMYKKLNKVEKSQEEIFNEISEKIHAVTFQERLYCDIIISYFVQSCEVYDAIAE